MAQEKQVEKMLETSKQWYASVEVGITVRLLIPSVDRPKIGHANLLDVVIEAGNGLYKIGTKSCILPQKFTRNQLEPSDNEFVLLEDVPEVEISFRAAVGADSWGEHCMYIGGYMTKKCACKKAEMICNSRCHHSKSCINT